MTEQQPQIEKEESREKTGKNIEISIHFVRHCKKDEKGKPTKEGLLETEEFGKTFTNKDAIKGYVSPIERVKRTAAAIIRESSIPEKKKKLKAKFGLSVISFSSDFKKSTYFATVKQRLNDAFSKPENERAEAIEKAEEENMEEWLNYGDQRPDKYTASPLEIAQNVAVLIDHYTRMSEKLYDSSKVDLLNATHEFVLAAMIKYLLKKKVDNKVLSGDEILKDMGRMDYLENVEIKVTTGDDKKDKEIKVVLRGEEYELDMDKMEEFRQTKLQKINE